VEGRARELRRESAVLTLEDSVTVAARQLGYAAQRGVVVEAMRNAKANAALVERACALGRELRALDCAGAVNVVPVASAGARGRRACPLRRLIRR